MLKTEWIEEGMMFANYIIDNRKSMTETARYFGTNASKVSKRISLLQIHEPELYDKVKALTEEIKLEKVRANGKKNSLNLYKKTRRY